VDRLRLESIRLKNVFYELHVGHSQRKALLPLIPTRRLADLGVNTIELMPLRNFPERVTGATTVFIPLQSRILRFTS